MFSAALVDTRTALLVFREMVSCVVLPGEEGELAIMDFHQPIIAYLKEGYIRVDDKIIWHIKRGVARSQRNELIVLMEK